MIDCQVRFVGDDLLATAFAQASLADMLIQRGDLRAAELALHTIPPVADAEGKHVLV
jgi:hypothetical protein